MSTYSKITRHPVTGVYELATWYDDYFGQHMYGVGFSDQKVYPAEQVSKAQLKEFWVEDVMEAFTRCRPFKDSENIELIIFLSEVNNAYKRRWERDPTGGEGAVDNLRNKK